MDKKGSKSHAVTLMRAYGGTIINNTAEIILRGMIEDYRMEENDIILEPLVVKPRLENGRVFVILIL
jgi:hypothetical protein